MRNFKKSLIALSVASLMGFPLISQAEDIVGSVVADNYTDYKVNVKNTATGLTREVSIASNGNFRLSSLPTGQYELVISKGGVVVAKDTVKVSIGKNTPVSFDLSNSEKTEVIQVTGSRVSAIDLTSTDSGLIIGEMEFDQLPVPRNLTAVALLAPGTVPGESRFGNVASFGGASPAENICYINGLDLTDTSQGLGCGSVPFEFYKEFQVKTGGFSAEYGRTTGGLINSTTKSGTNEWEFAATLNHTPSSLAGDGRVSKGSGGTGNAFRNTTLDEYSATDFTVSAGGPLIEDKLFIYAIVNPRDITDDFASRSGTTQYAPDNQFIKRESSGGDNLFWGTKIDWLVTDQHTLTFFGYSNRSDTESNTYAFNANTNVVGNQLGTTILKRGGDVKSISYTGNLTDDFTVTAIYGEIETEYTNVPGNLDCPTVTDARDVPDSEIISSCGPGGSFGDNIDTTDQFRLNAKYIIGDHLVKAGYEKQTRDTYHISAPITGHNWTYRTLAPNGSIQGNDGALYVNNTGADLDYVADRIFTGGGGFTSEVIAMYVEDEWQVTDNLRLNMGLRRDEFENYGVTGLVFSSFKTDVAPRLGFSFDPTGEGESKFFGTYGRYYLPVPNNTNYRAASGISDATTYYTFTGSDSTGAATGLTPIAGANSTVVNSVPNPAVQATFQAEEADPFAKDEYIIGYETTFNDQLSGSVRGIFREVVTALDDYCGPYASQASCTLMNPGQDSTWQLDNDFDGVIDPDSRRTYTAAELGLPEAKNEYTAIQTQLDYKEERTRLTLIYTWSRSHGNFEGAVKSDIAQADPGITQDFDFPALMDGADGYQANDRRHVFKMFGAYKFTDDFTVGFNSTLTSGRALSAFGRGYPTDDPLIYGSYGDTFYLYDPVADTYSRNSRGTMGRTGWSFNVDLSANYSFEIGKVDMRAYMNIYNVLDSQEIMSQNEHYETTPGVRNQYYGAAYTWQDPRSVQFGIEARF
ncbi:MAG: TonB-dependent receptor [Gammaproteobacteria bacterium]|nr:TonB-dependent receptor [Gammaproteobacteria bacterium]